MWRPEDISKKLVCSFSLYVEVWGRVSNVGHQTSKASLLLHYLTSPKDAFRGLDHDSVGVVLA